MRQKNHTKQRRLIMPAVLFALAAILSFAACKKNDTASLPEENKMQKASTLLGGQLLTGKLVNGGSEDKMVYLDFNDGQKVIFLQMASSDPLDIPCGDNAVIITSSHGLIIKHPGNSKVLLFPQNDTESIRKFTELSSIFKQDYSIAPIAGTTLLNFNS